MRLPSEGVRRLPVPSHSDSRKKADSVFSCARNRPRIRRSEEALAKWTGIDDWSKKGENFPLPMIQYVWQKRGCALSCALLPPKNKLTVSQRVVHRIQLAEETTMCIREKKSRSIDCVLRLRSVAFFFASFFNGTDVGNCFQTAAVAGDSSLLILLHNLLLLLIAEAHSFTSPPPSSSSSSSSRRGYRPPPQRPVPKRPARPRPAGRPGGGGGGSGGRRKPV